MDLTVKYEGEGVVDNFGLEIDYVPDNGGASTGLWDESADVPGENIYSLGTFSTGTEVTGGTLYLVDEGSTGKFEISVDYGEPVVVKP